MYIYIYIYIHGGHEGDEDSAVVRRRPRRSADRRPGYISNLNDIILLLLLLLIIVIIMSIICFNKIDIRQALRPRQSCTAASTYIYIYALSIHYNIYI